MPRHRGINVNGTAWDDGAPPVTEEELGWIAGWGLDFVRLVLSPQRLDGPGLDALDRLVEAAGRHGLHACLDFHEAPGYAIWAREPPAAGADLFRDPAPRERFLALWAALAARYRGIPAAALSFDLLNEPPVMADDTEGDLERLFAHPHAGSASAVTTGAYEELMRAAVAAVRAHDPARAIVVEGTNMAQTPLPRAFYEELGVVAGLHFYLPMTVTHYGADHAAGMADGAPPPAWPSPAPSVTGDRARFGGEIARAFGMDSDAPWTRTRLEESLAPWLALADAGIPVHLGECGVIRHTPHAVALAYLRDLLSVLAGHDLGFSLWALRDPDYGLLGSARRDAALAPWHGTTLDRALLAVLQGG